ncbi:ABC transporter ATP-binding protein [Pseudoalteromonas sp. T1lg75]|uniref:ABC transporter ATP-binding protein n=1 Tax=Pseudoalteromonas sp. T1lg75 TaxID=2077102 RepID=UPI000CF6B92A|nr:ABC transporter ATP-binding protein [Pseudoalteromonas sp. T1lg75]
MLKKITWRYLKELVVKHKKHLLFAHFAAITATLLSVPIPLMMPLIVDEVLLAKPAEATALFNQLLPPQWQTQVGYILAVLVLVILMRLASAVFTVIQDFYFAVIGKSVSYKVRAAIIERLANTRLVEFETHGVAAMTSRTITDVDTIESFISQTVSGLIMGVLSLVGTAIILLLINWQIALIILVLNPIVISFSRSFGKRVTNLKLKENNAFEAFQHALVETLDTITQLKVAQRDKHYFGLIVDAARDLKARSTESQWQTNAVHQTSFTIFLLGFEVFKALAMLLVVLSDLTVGQMFAIFGYLWFMMGPIQSLLSVQYSYYSAKAAMERINDVFSYSTEHSQPSPEDVTKKPSPSSITIENLHFSYSPPTAVLEGVELSIPARKTTALVATTGGGKSTLVKLLFGLYSSDSGCILFDGKPIETLGYNYIRNNIAVVMQQSDFLNSTIKENLTLGKQVTNEQIQHALRIAELNSLIDSLPAGLDTMIGRNGVRLSGGERQRLAIARMVLDDPQNIVLDEATSALDSQTEQKILANLHQHFSDRTCLVIAHRLSAIKHADQVYVLEAGKVRESGDHETLIRQQGLYHSIFAMQLS